jgi:hypothetical protein
MSQSPIDQSTPSGNANPLPSVEGSTSKLFWNSLQELCDVAMLRGWNKPQFDEAVASVGDDPFLVANYLQRDIFHRTADCIEI